MEEKRDSRGGSMPRWWNPIKQISQKTQRLCAFDFVALRPCQQALLIWIFANAHSALRELLPFPNNQSLITYNSSITS
jgi:hypothetical protein